MSRHYGTCSSNVFFFGWKWTKDVWAWGCLGKLQITRWLGSGLFWQTHQNMGFGQLRKGFRLLLWRPHLQINCQRRTSTRQENVTQVFSWLDSSFQTIISQFLNMNPLSSIVNVYNMVIRKERHCVIARVEAVIFTTTVTNDESRITSPVCHETWHSSLDFFQVISFLNR